MADKQTIEEVLSLLASNYGRRPGWGEDLVDLWYRRLGHVQASRLVEAVEELCDERAHMPRLADVRDRLGRVRGETIQLPPGCDHCEQSGWRQLARHWTVEGRLHVATFAGTCDCQLGAHYGQGPAVMGWQEMVEMWRRNSGTVACYWTTRDKLRLSIEEAWHPEAVVRVRDQAVSGRQAERMVGAAMTADGATS